MEKITIRKAKANDLKDILRLNLDLFKKEYKEYDKKLNLKWTYGKVGKTYFKKRISEKSSFVFVAENEEEIVGYLCGGLKPQVPVYLKARYAELENMIIDRKFRNKGIGKKLVEEFLKWRKKNKVNRVYVKAFAKNEKGIKFYRKIGFKNYSLILEI